VYYNYIDVELKTQYIIYVYKCKKEDKKFSLHKNFSFKGKGV